MKRKVKHLILLCIWAIIAVLFELSIWSTGYSALIVFVGGVAIYVSFRRLITSLNAASKEAMRQFDERMKARRQEQIGIIHEAIGKHS